MLFVEYLTILARLDFEPCYLAGLIDFKYYPIDHF